MKVFNGMLRGRFDIKTCVIGSGSLVVDSAVNGSPNDSAESDRSEKEVQEGKVLNRIVRWTPDGWELEADQRHAELIVEQMGLTGAKGGSTAGEYEKKHEVDDTAALLEKEKAALFRSIAARATYLSQDRSDIMYATKEICRKMSSPTVGAWKSLKRLARYLIRAPRCVAQYAWQGRENEIAGYTDSDWAG